MRTEDESNVDGYRMRSSRGRYEEKTRELRRVLELKLELELELKLELGVLFEKRSDVTWAEWKENERGMDITRR